MDFDQMSGFRNKIDQKLKPSSEKTGEGLGNTM
jgi:hypothetical protein